MKRLCLKLGFSAILATVLVCTIGARLGSATEQRGESVMLTVTRVDVLERVFPDRPPESMAPAELRHVPRGGSVPFQFAVSAETKDTCVMSVVSVKRKDDDVPLACRTTWYEVLPVHVEANSQGCSSTSPYPAQPPEDWKPYFVREAPFDIEEVLVEASEIEVQPGRQQAVLVDVSVATDAEPGEYQGLLQLKSTHNGTAEVVFPLAVHPTIIHNYKLNSTHWFWPQPENLTTGPLPEWWSEEHWRLIENSAGTLRKFGDNVILTPLMGGDTIEMADHPLIQTYVTPEGTYEFDHSRFERWCETFLSLGFKTIEGGHVSDGHNIAPIYVYAIDRRSGEKSLLFNPESDVEQWLDFLRVFFKDFRKILEKRGWADVYMQHLMDEPHDVKEYQRLAEVFRPSMPGIHSFDAIQNRVFSPYCDIMVFNLGTIVSSQDLVAERKSQGQSVWHYQCCSPYPPEPNRWMDRHLFNSRLYPWLGYLLNSDGYLFWAANLYRGADPYKTSIGPMPSGSQDPGHPVGDAWTYFPGPNGLRGSMRMLAFREGMIDHTLLCMLAEKDKAAADSIMNTIARTTQDYQQDSDSYHQARKDLLEALEH